MAIRYKDLIGRNIAATDENESILHVARTRSELVDGPDFQFEDYGEQYRTLLVEHYLDQKRADARRSKDSLSGSFHVGQ